jgi:exodeoxyribonuclease V alpha subunit
MDPYKLYRKIEFSSIDRALAEMVVKFQPQRDAWVLLAVALTSKFAAKGHVCLDLGKLTAEGVPDDGILDCISLNISLEELIQRLTASPVVGEPGEFTPLILHWNYLYLHRFWSYESNVAHELKRRCRSRIGPPAMMQALADIGKWFPKANPQQIQAIQYALTKTLTIISGGPGSGKTFTIAMLIVLLNRLTHARNFRIQLAAPTGKAAFRLQAAIRDAMQDLLTESENDQLVFESASTVHRMLGAIPGQLEFRFNSRRKLPADMIVVDEASMIDLGMMANLLAALSSDTQLILLGDKDQLASVAPGAVLGDICSGINGNESPQHGVKQPHGAGTPIGNHIVVLQERYRFGIGGAIDSLGRAIKSGRARQALALLNDPNIQPINIRSVAEPKLLETAIQTVVSHAISRIFACDDPAEALQELDGFKLLTPLRDGPYGVESLNSAVERALVDMNAIRVRNPANTEWYAGRPVMITRNDYAHRLFNGDIGITMTERINKQIRYVVYFTDIKGGLKRLSTEELAYYETAYAMTVHKSQGSEFENVVLVLPTQESPILSRELLYTGITRARKSVEIWGDAKVFISAVNTGIKRMSGLAYALWH